MKSFVILLIDIKHYFGCFLVTFFDLSRHFFPFSVQVEYDFVTSNLVVTIVECHVSQ